MWFSTGKKMSFMRGLRKTEILQDMLFRSYFHQVGQRKILTSHQKMLVAFTYTLDKIYKSVWPIGHYSLTLSWRKSLLYRNMSIDLLWKSMDWLLYDGDLHHERVKLVIGNLSLEVIATVMLNIIFSRYLNFVFWWIHNVKIRDVVIDITAFKCSKLSEE